MNAAASPHLHLAQFVSRVACLALLAAELWSCLLLLFLQLLLGPDLLLLKQKRTKSYTNHGGAHQEEDHRGSNDNTTNSGSSETSDPGRKDRHVWMGRGSLMQL
jgi:hypothetical protein